MKINKIGPNLGVKSNHLLSNVVKTTPMQLDSVTFTSNIKINEKQFVKLRDVISKKLKILQMEAENTSFEYYANCTSENMKKMQISQDKINEFYNNREIYSKLKDINDSGGVADKKLKKQLRSLITDFGDSIEYKKELAAIRNKENEIAQKFNTHQMQIDGKNVTNAQISKILATEKNPIIRKKAFDERVKLGDLVADDIVELVKIRNDFAQKKGYKNFYEYKLIESYDIAPKELDVLTKEITQKIGKFNKKSMDKVKNDLSKVFDIKPENIKKYHLNYISNGNPAKDINDKIKSPEEVVEIAKNAYKNMGYNIDRLPIVLDVFPRKNKYLHAFSSSIEPGKQSKILANLNNDVLSLDIIMHELGHSVYFVNIDTKLPYLEQMTTNTMSEAVAIMMGDLKQSENILKSKVPSDVLNKYKEASSNSDSSFIFSMMSYMDFEKNMYKNPNQDLKQLWKDVNVKYRGLNPNDEATNEWATTPHFLSYPAYCQNYFRSKLIKAQLYKALTEKLGNLTENKKTAKYLNEHIFKYGGSKDDNEILKEVTGKPLSADAFCQSIDKQL